MRDRIVEEGDGDDGAWVWDRRSTLDYGRHPALQFVDGVATADFEGVNDPIPAAGWGPHDPTLLQGDPFNDPRRLLVLTLASDCAALPDSQLYDLLSLSTLPGVVVAVAPGLDARGFRDALRLDVTLHASSLTAEAKADPSSRRWADSGRVGDRLWDRQASTPFDPALFEVAEHVLRLPHGDARRLAVEVVAHEALGHDYIVSPGLAAGARRRRGWWWPRRKGTCSPGQAMRLAGAKARMYRMIPLAYEPMRFSINVGMWLDLAAMNFTPGLREALKGALAPGATSGEEAAADHLLAIRGRLTELLQSRDAIYRLVRREALDPQPSRGRDEEEAGVTGNDLIARLSYHLTAALDAAYGVGDNLAWVLARRDETTGADRIISFTGLVGGDKARRHRWREGAHAAAGAAAVLASPRLPFMLAVREVRNLRVHREGVDTGPIRWGPPRDAPIRRLSGWWIHRRRLGTHRLRDGRDIELSDALAQEADYVSDAFVAFAFVPFVDTLWKDTATLAGGVLRSIDWPSARRWRPRLTPGQRLWRQRSQRRLWGL